MIDVTQLTKRYADTLALDHVSFSIQPGEVVGLLGPNGAGKTTMLKMLTGYLPPTEGTAKVANLDILDYSLQVRQKIGYLPETNPLYDDFAVYESLQWAARLRAIPEAKASAAIGHVIGVCGLEAVVSKDIGQLSKGYRQRVGLAQAILHDPEILILDEPTSGLDPNQQQEVRQLIQKLKLKKTVLWSTHVLSEAQQSCSRVLIINRGRIVADGSPDVLGRQTSGAGRLRVELKAPVAAARDALAVVPGVRHLETEKESGHSVTFAIECSPGDDVREALFYVAAERRWPILQLTTETASLEDVFRQLTIGGPVA